MSLIDCFVVYDPKVVSMMKNAPKQKYRKLTTLLMNQHTKYRSLNVDQFGVTLRNKY
jgi:hypothetical protein